MRPSPATLARGRAMNEANLPHTAVAEVPTPGVDDGEGGTIPGESIVFSFPCRVVHPSSETAQQEVPFADALKLPGTIILAFGVDVALPSTAEVTVYRDSGSARYDVAGIVPMGSYSVLQRAVLKLTQQEVAS